MPNRRHSSNRPGSFFGNLFHGNNQNDRRENQRRASHHDHHEDDYYNDYQGRSTASQDYQFDRDPGAFDSKMQDRSGSQSSRSRSRSEKGRRQGRAASEDMGYNYQGSLNRDEQGSMNRESYWSPSQEDVSWGSEGRGINSGTSNWGRDIGSANAPGSYQGHGIEMGPSYHSTRGYEDARSRADYNSYEGSGSGYGADMGSSGSGYGSFEGTAGSNYKNYESTNPPHRGSWGSTEDWRSHQSARQSMGSGYGSYQGSSQSSQGNFQGPTQGFSQQSVNPGFQEDNSENSFSRRSSFGKYEGISATDQYEGLATGFSGPFREDRPSSRGLHHGKGPKGYRRSDERIKDDVCYALMLAPDVDASHIEVEVSQGVVTLNGSVSERRMKRLAEDCIDNVQGVTDVHNQLKVQSADESFRSEAPSQGRTSSGSGDADFTQDSKSRNRNQKS